MIANPKWFKRRKYTGWGITPKTWQAWVYLTCVVLLLIIVTITTESYTLTRPMQLSIIFGLLVFFIFDMMSASIKLDKDERESQHEAIAERNAAWTMVAIFVFALVYQILISIKANAFLVDPFIITGLSGAVLVKAISNWYLLDK